MNIPGFAASASAYQPGNRYSSIQRPGSYATGRLQPADFNSCVVSCSVADAACIAAVVAAAPETLGLSAALYFACEAGYGACLDACGPNPPQPSGGTPGGGGGNGGGGGKGGGGKGGGGKGHGI